MKTLRSRCLALALALAGFIVVTTAPLFLRARTVEAEEPMAANPPPIDGQRAYKYLKQVCEIGPHTAGSPANTKLRAMVAAHFTNLGGVVKEQPFGAQDPKSRRKLTMANLVGSWFPDRDQRVVIGAHYDTRPHPDQEDDPERQKLPFIGANDPGSGVALLMEIAHHLKDLPTEMGVDLVLFDGEELVYGDGEQRLGRYFLGSDEFARIYANKVARRRDRQRYHYGIVLDMVGGKDLIIDQEPTSLNNAPQLMRSIWGVARELNARSFRVQEGREVMDDHIALIKAGIPTVDLIDFNYKFWHKADDLPDNCSAESLAEVGRVVTGWLTVAKKQR
jgi:glutaminyl-peptide cyclotransferase